MLGGGGGHTFRDMGGAVLRYGRCGNVLWEAGKLDMQDWWPSG